MGGYFPSVPKVGRALWRGVRCFGRGLRKFGRSMIYVLPVLVLIHLIAVVVTGRQLQGDIDRLTKAGILVPAKDLIPSVPPGAENAADVYRKAWDALSLSTLDEDTLFNQYAKHDANWLVLARRVVTANQEYYRLIDHASAMPVCVFPVDWQDSFAASFPHFTEMRRAARVLSLRAYVDVADGRVDEAVASVTALLRVGEQAKTDPIIIADLVSYSIQGIGIRTLQDVLQTGTPSPGACRTLYDQIGSIDNVRSSGRAMRGELSHFGLGAFEAVRSGRVSIITIMHGEGDASPRGRPRPWDRARAWLLRPMLNADERVYLGYMEQEVRAFELPWPESHELTDKLYEGLDTRTPAYAILTRTIMPIFGRAVWSRDRTTAANGTAQIALALKAYRADHASYTTSLAELEAAGWKLPLDPFGGKPYHYRREGAGFVVWSIGPDMVDQNARIDYDMWLKAKPQKQDWGHAEYDIVFRVKR